MKHPYIIILSGILWLAATPVHAASEQCAQLKGLTAISSHYVQKVLDRADNGIMYAKTAGKSDDFKRYLPGWAKTIRSTWAGLIDSEIQRTFEARELTNATACLHFDTLLIECKMEEVGEELHQQIEAESIGAIMGLLDLLQFLNERRRYLQKGALDPLLNDPTWGDLYSFDDPSQAWCCPAGLPGNSCTQQSASACANSGGMQFSTLSQCVAWGCTQPAGQTPNSPNPDAICPFNADYAPAFQNGFGCDVETMLPRAGYPPMEAERQALTIISTQVDEFRRSALEFLAVQKEIDQLFGNPSTTIAPPPQRQHRNAFGCGWMGGYCEKNDDKYCYTNDDCANDGACVIPEKICEKNLALRCTKDEHCGASGPCVTEKICAQDANIRCTDDAHCGTSGPCTTGDITPDLRALRGPFSLDKNQVSIISDFLEVRSQQDISRSYSNELKLPAEFQENQQAEKDDRAWDEQNPFTKYLRQTARITVNLWSRMQSRKEAAAYPEAVDAQLEIANSLTGLRTAISELSLIASAKNNGLRAFVTRYAYFLRRTCIHRSCSLLLDQVIRIATTDDCFPYTNGEFLNDTEEDPRWEKCKDKAGIE